MINSLKNRVFLMALTGVAVLALSAGPGAAAEGAKKDAPKTAEPSGEEQANFAVNLFMEACLGHGGDKDGLRKWAKDEMKMPEMKGDTAKPFLQNTPDQAGVVWSASGPQGQFVLVSEDNGACTVYSHAAEDKAVHERMVWLKKKLDEGKGKQNISYDLKTDNDKEKNLKRTIIAVRRPDQGNDVGMIATTSGKNKSLSAIITIFAMPSGQKL